MGITRRSESNLTPFFHLALGRAEAKRDQEIVSNQFGFEEQAALAQSLSDWSAEGKQAAISAAGGVGSLMGGFARGGMQGAGKGLFKVIPKGGGGGGGMGAGGGGLTGTGGGGGGTPGDTPRLSDVIVKDRFFGDRTSTGQAPSTGAYADPTYGGNVNLSTAGGRAAFSAAVRQNAAQVANERRVQAATVAYQRDFQMQALQSGALADYAQPGYTNTQKGDLAGLQTARNVVTAGASRGGGFRLHPRHQQQALRLIDQEMQNILDSPSMVPLTPEERAARKAPTPEQQINNGVIERGPRGLGISRNGEPRVLWDDVKENIDIEKLATERVAARQYGTKEIPKMWEEMTAKEQDAILAEEVEKIKERTHGQTTQIGEDPYGPGGQQGQGDVQDMPYITEDFDPNQLEVGVQYKVRAKGGKDITVVWTGTGYDTNIPRGMKTSAKFLEDLMKRQKEIETIPRGRQKEIPAMTLPERRRHRSKYLKQVGDDDWKHKTSFGRTRFEWSRRGKKGKVIGGRISRDAGKTWRVMTPEEVRESFARYGTE